MIRQFALPVWVVIAAMGCGGAREAAPANSCRARDAAVGRDASFDSRAGEYRLILVATSGDSADREVAGTLWLEPNDAAARQFARPGGDPDPTVSVPLYGWTDVSVRGVGAREIGDLGSREPTSPGVLVLEQRRQPSEPAEITLRIGSLANRRDAPRFDGAYMALRVRWLDDSGGFGGSWASGVQGVESEGHFCAAPVQ